MPRIERSPIRPEADFVAVRDSGQGIDWTDLEESSWESRRMNFTTR